MPYYRPPGPAPDPALVRSLSEQQLAMRQHLRFEPLPTGQPHFIAGCDSSFPTPDTILSVFVVLRFPSLELVEKVYSYGAVTMPYVPGYLSFREAPNVALAFAKLRQRPDVIMVDGHGIAHPRRMGIAAHLGMVLDVPTFGVAKNKLTGTFSRAGAGAGQPGATHRCPHGRSDWRGAAQQRPGTAAVRQPRPPLRPGHGHAPHPGLPARLQAARTHPPGRPLGRGVQARSAGLSRVVVAGESVIFSPLPLHFGVELLSLADCLGA